MRRSSHRAFWKECGITALAHRKKLLAAIAALPAAGGGDLPLTVPTRPPRPESGLAPSLDPSRADEVEGITKPVVSDSITNIPRAPAPSLRPAPAPPSRPALPPPLASTSPAAPPPIPASSPAVKRPGFWAKLVASKFLFISIVAHLLFGVGATYFIVQRISAKRKVTFQSGPPSINPSNRALEHKVSMAKKKKTGGAPPQAKRIVSAGIAKVSLPDLPSIPTANTVLPGMVTGLGGAGFGTGMGFGSGAGSGMGGGGGGGRRRGRAAASAFSAFGAAGRASSSSSISPAAWSRGRRTGTPTIGWRRK